MREHRILATPEEAHAMATEARGEFRRPLKWQPRLSSGSQEPRFERDRAMPTDWNLYATGGFHGAIACPFGAVGDRIWVAETWREKYAKDGLIFRADPLECGHSREGRIYVRYRCNLAAFQNGCQETHGAAKCSTCFDAGTDRPKDFYSEIKRKKLGSGPWRAASTLKRSQARSVVEVASVRIERRESIWEWVVGWEQLA